MDLSGLLSATAVIGFVAWLARQESLASAQSPDSANGVADPAQASSRRTGFFPTAPGTQDPRKLTR
jgi:hypothetical protein